MESASDSSIPPRSIHAEADGTVTNHHGERDRYASGDYSFWSRVFEPASETLTEAAGVSARGPGARRGRWQRQHGPRGCTTWRDRDGT